MKHPAYHLRPNKAVDRFMLLEAIKYIGRIYDLSRYTYYSLGGPYLEDFRLLHEHYPEISLVSIEEDPDTIKRQKFHLPCRKIALKQAQLRSFLNQYVSKDKRSIFWLDYINLTWSNIEEFQVILGKVATNSLIKITLRCEPKDYVETDSQIEFRSKFEAVLPDSVATFPRDLEPFAKLIQDMLQIAAQQALPASLGTTFQPLSSFCYADGVGIFTLTGVVCQETDRSTIRNTYDSWRFKNLNWASPTRIDVPMLTTRERLHLQRHLPCKNNDGERLLKLLGYAIDDGQAKSIRKLEQYALFHKYSPYFIRAIP